MKSAAILFVKNEYSDIIGWVYWYINLGFDKIVIYDDHSDDGTFEILSSIKSQYNLDIYRSELDKYGTFYWRQRDAYMHTAYRLKEEYDWVIFLDADEYLFFEKYSKVNDFLKNFKFADAIAINWCIFGSSNKAMRNKEITPFTYLWRADETLGDACLVKGFVRPNKLNGSYFNPHKHEILSENYYDAEGCIVDWLPGTTKKINWENARIMHYICRSMEHYSCRIRKRFEENSSNQTENWDRFNRNDVYDESALKYKNESILSLKFQVIDAIVNGIRDKYGELVHHNCNQCYNEHSYTVYSIFNKNGEDIFLNSDCFITTKKERKKVYFISNDEGKGFIAYKNDINQFCPVNIKYSNCGLLASFCFFEENNKFFTLKNLFTDKYISCNLRIYSDLEANREIPNDWENFIIKKNDHPDIKIKKYFRFSSNNYYDFIRWVCSSDDGINKFEFIFNFSILTQKDRQKCFDDFYNLWFNII